MHIGLSFYSCPVLMKLEFPRQSFEKYSNINFNGNLITESGIVACRQTDRYQQADSLFSLFF